MKVALAAIVLLISACNTANAQNHTLLKPTRIRVSARALDGIAIKRVLPNTPCGNDEEHENGVVTIAVVVDYDGKVKDTSLLSGDPILASCAVPAIQQWLFKPYVLNADPVQVESRIVMKFSNNHAQIVLGER